MTDVKNYVDSEFRKDWGNITQIYKVPAHLLSLAGKMRELYVIIQFYIQLQHHPCGPTSRRSTG